MIGALVGVGLLVLILLGFAFWRTDAREVWVVVDRTELVPGKAPVITRFPAVAATWYILHAGGKRYYVEKASYEKAAPGGRLLLRKDGAKWRVVSRK